MVNQENQENKPSQIRRQTHSTTIEVLIETRELFKERAKKKGLTLKKYLHLLAKKELSKGE